MNYSVPAKIKYVAEVKDVREVTLLANADLTYWRENLKNEGFVPYDDNGKAELMISSADLVWKGMRSQEVSVCINVCCNNKNKPDGYFLIHAFNSSRLFAFIERNVFHTPYYYGQIRILDQIPVSVVVSTNEETVLAIHMSENRLPERVETRQWDGPVFLPRPQGKKNDKGKLFFARISGLTDVYSYQPSSDLIRLQGLELQMLRESGLAGKEWQIRKNAAHAKSKTYNVC